MNGTDAILLGRCDRLIADLGDAADSLLGPAHAGRFSDLVPRALLHARTELAILRAQLIRRAAA